MGRYGIDYYGAAYYGSANPVAYSASPFTATPFNYRSILLSWVTPTGNWDYLRLVRNPYGFPITADDGDILFEDAKASSRSYFEDTGTVPNNVGLKENHFYYYSVFVRQTSDSTWQSAGSALGASVKDNNTSNNMYNYLPSVLTSQIPYDASIEDANTDLKRFLSLFAFNLDLYKCYAENVQKRFDIENLNGILVPVFMRQFGLTYEPELGLKQSRILLNNAIRLRKNKGTKIGLQEYIKAYAGYDNTIAMSKNLMLDKNDSSFEESIGSWSAVANCSITRHTATDSPTITPFNETSSQAIFPNLQSAVLRLTGTASGTAEIALANGDPMRKGIPVTSGTTYVFSAYATSAVTSRKVVGKLYWYDREGVLISSSSDGSEVSTTTNSWMRASISQQAPTGAYFCVPHLKVKSTINSEKHFFDCLQFEIGSSATSFKEARQIMVTLVANRVNEILNPNFESNTDNWTITNGTLTLSTLEVESDHDSPSVAISGGSVEIYPLATGLVTLTSNAMNVFADNDYAFSMYAYESGGNRPITPFISWYDSSNTLISTVEGTPITGNTTWQRPSVVGASPSNAVTAKTGLKWTATNTSNEMYVDAALFEKSSFVNSFFDGSNGIAQTADLFWEGGAANAARSHYYINRYSIENRLMATLTEWVPYGSTFELLFAQPS